LSENRVSTSARRSGLARYIAEHRQTLTVVEAHADWGNTGSWADGTHKKIYKRDEASVLLTEKRYIK
jgi:hypothetical protein